MLFVPSAFAAESATTQQSKGFEHDFYDGFYITYGNCNVDVATIDDAEELLQNKPIKLLFDELFKRISYKAQSFCDVI